MGRGREGKGGGHTDEWYMVWGKYTVRSVAYRIESFDIPVYMIINIKYQLSSSDSFDTRNIAWPGRLSNDAR